MKKAIMIMMTILMMMMTMFAYPAFAADRSEPAQESSDYIYGIDVSKMNQEQFPDSKALQKYLKKHREIRFVQIRCGGRGYGKKGTLYSDHMWKEYVKACRKAKVPFGIYFYSSAINKEEADEEVQYIKDCINEVKDYSMFKLGVTLDIEQRRGSRTEGILWTGEMAKLAQRQVKKLRKKTYVTIYSDVDTYKVSGLSSVSGCNFWLARLTDDESEYFKFDLYPDDGDIVAHQVSWDGGLDKNVATEEYVA